MTTINEFLAPRIIENQTHRLNELKRLNAPSVIIAQTEKNIKNPSKLIKDRLQSGKKEFSNVEKRKTAIIFSFDDNQNKCVFLFKTMELTWMLDYQIEKIK